MVEPRTASRVHRATRLARRLIPRDGDLRGLLVNVSRHRGRPLTLMAHDLGSATGLSGLWLATATSDYIVIDASASPSRQAIAVSHEVAHMLLEHRGELTTIDIGRGLAPDLNPGLVARFLARHGYATLDEREAEELATAIVMERERRERLAPPGVDSIAARLR